MPKINHEEYEILKSLDEKWKWMARDKDRGLYAFTEKPVRKYDPSPYWDTETEEDYSALELFDEIHLFQFIQWEDEEPYNIAELIEEYESEETEVKTLESIREEIWEEMLSLEDKRLDRWADIKYQTLREVLQKLGHLDEPEVLSQELPVIPKFVAEWIEDYKEREDIYTALSNAFEGMESVEIYNWVSGYTGVANQETFARAWLDGFTVEEQKYIVSDNSSIPLLIKNDSGEIVSYDSQIAYNNSNGTIELTEQEIKDYDERYWPFAVKVEELEE